jgi:serine/threonine-protein kinase
MASSSDRNLLFGILALQMDFITRDALVAGMNAWVLQKNRPLGDLLVEQGALAAADQALLEPLVRRHVEQHGGDASKSLASLSSVDWIGPALEPVGKADRDVQETLAKIQQGQSATDPNETAIASYPGLSTPGGIRYRIVRLHARGGLGEVFIARDIELHREVAVKQIQDRHSDHPESRSRFLLEAEITGGLEHPGIVPVYGLGHNDDGRPFYAMRFIKGDSLKEAIERFHQREKTGRRPGERMLELQKLLRRFLDVCNAIAYAHSRGVLHRDIKPGNIMVGQYGETLVVDWGMAKVVGARERTSEGTLRPPSASGSSETLPGSAIGTPAYMSPEQAAGRLDQLGPASDVYSLGATLYSLLTGRPPHASTGGDIDDVLERARQGRFPTPRQLKADTPRALEAICLKAMATDQANRYSSPRELADDIERWLADEPVSAWREPISVRARRWMRRHRTAVAAAAATILVALAALAITYRREVAANRQLRLAKTESDRRLDQTLEAIQDYYTGVSEEVLLGQKEFQPLREKLLAKPREFYEKLARELEAAPASDERSRYLLARGRLNLAKILFGLGHLAEAEKQWREAIALYEALVAIQPRVLAYQQELTACRSGLGAALGTRGDHQRAIEELRRAIKLVEEPKTKNASLSDYQQKVRASSYTSLGRELHETGDVRGAIVAHRRAIELFEPVAQSQPSVAEFQDVLGRSYHGLANGLAATGDHDHAINEFRRTVKLYEELVAARPGNRSYQGTLGMARSSLGRELLATGDSRGATEVHRRAVDRNQALVAAQPNVPDYQLFLAISQQNLGTALLRMGDPRGAIEAHRSAIKVLEALRLVHPDVPDYQARLAQSNTDFGGVLDATGDIRGAIEAHRRANRIYEALVAAQPNVPAYQNGLGASWNNLGKALVATTDIKGSIEAFRQAIKARTPLVAAHPNVPDYQGGLANTYGDLAGVLSGAGDIRGSIEAGRRATAMFEALVAAHSSVSNYQGGLSNAFRNLAIALMRARDSRGATEACRRAIEVDQALATAEPNVPGYTYRLAQSYGLLGISLFGTGDVLGARDAARQAVEKLETLRAAQSQLPNYQETLAMNQNRLGVLLLNTGDSRGAIETFGKAIKLREALVAAHPGIPEFRNGLAASNASLGLALNELRRERDALAPLRAAVEHGRIAFKSMPQVNEFRAGLNAAYKGLTACLRRLGRISEAAETARERIKNRLNRPDELYDAACELALCVPRVDEATSDSRAEKERLAAEAVQTLRAAVAAGWNDAAHTSRDRDFIALRDRADFRKLVDELFDRTFPANPFARS